MDVFLEKRGVSNHAHKMLLCTPVPIMSAALDVLAQQGELDANLLRMFSMSGTSKYCGFPMDAIDDAAAILTSGVFATEMQLQALESRMVLRA